MTAPVGGGWTGSELAAAPQTWRLAIPADAAAELTGTATRLVAARTPLDATAPAPDLPAAVLELADAARDRLVDGPGLALLTGFPSDTEPAVHETAYWLLGRALGRPVSQTRDGAYLTRVEDRGADISRPVERGHRSSAALPFHADRTDVIGLLCVRAASEGGASRVVSSRALHDTVLAERPDLLPVLYATLPNDQRGEEQPGSPGWCPLPVFSQEGGHFAARYVRRFIEGSQRHDDAPRLSPRQLEAMSLLDEIMERPGFALEMELAPGDVQLIDNFTLLHSRAAFRDTPGHDGGRLLLRLWLAFSGSPQLPEEYRALFGDVAAGGYRGGVWPPGGLPRLELEDVTA